MPAILILPQHKELVDGKEVTVCKGATYLVRDTTHDFSTTYGTIKKKDLLKNGKLATASTGKKFTVFQADFIDLFKRLRKLPQTIPLKDLSIIAAETGVGPQSSVVDAGTGSGAVCCFFAHLCKHVTSYEIRSEFQEQAKQNATSLGLSNITFKLNNCYKGIAERNVDIVIYDVPEPWNGIPCAIKALRVGGWLVSYSPSVPQMMDFCSAVTKEKKLLIIKSIEITERVWEVNARRVRPKSIPIGHSGFITFVRKVIA